MGKIRSRMIKRTSEELLKRGVEFSEDFEKNKKVLGGEMPSKKTKNQIAGYLSTLKRKEREREEELNA
jgi:ribosomal protein S17E